MIGELSSNGKTGALFLWARVMMFMLVLLTLPINLLILIDVRVDLVVNISRLYYYEALGCNKLKQFDKVPAQPARDNTRGERGHDRSKVITKVDDVQRFWCSVSYPQL